MPINNTLPGNKVEYLRLIETRLQAFRAGAFADNAINLLHALGYRSDKTLGYELGTAAGLLELANRKDFFSREKARPAEWLSVDFLFQLTDEEVRNYGQTASAFDSKQVDVNSATQIETYIFFALELKPKEDGYPRTALADITREINRLFPMPALILFKHGNTLTLSVINRRLHKRAAARDVLEKVTLIKDIRIENPHRAHVEILYDLAFSQLSAVHAITNFVELHDAWRKPLDISELNKRFYKDLANWYFWALEHVEFPAQQGMSVEMNRATNVIRLITRLIFVWFLKERLLVPDDLFHPEQLSAVLKDLKPASSTFYKAILQNLFFATLNTPMRDKDNPREFRTDTDAGKRFNDQYMVHNQYRHKKLFRDPAAALGMFASVPFLNGGLFECLDKREEAGGKLVETRVDGFSDVERKQPTVPNRLFFCAEHNCAADSVDLNAVYGTTRKTYKVRGLIDTLDRYKFTIAENTPIEEEVALDPELLGKVFENLLASYNPETGATARKQTGSFYTPRAIVNYMVDESLIAYLETQMALPASEAQSNSTVMRQADAQSSFVGQQPFVLAAAADPATGVAAEDSSLIPHPSSLQSRLRQLFAYTDEAHGFTDAEVERLIKAIDEVKILDPACGSGAFPLGILGKLVFILAKLDPQNARWKQRQIDRVRAAMRVAEKIEDDKFRERTLQDLAAQIGSIEEAFERNELDYGRKLYLIENCIYGVDIQPIAIQISKLRFFISLIIDQKIRAAAENLGIRPLPNLETKFIAANALLSLEKPEKAFLRNTAIDEKERDLKIVRERYFTARTTRTKEKFRRADERLRQEIGALLEAEGNFPHETTAQLVAWNPYDQNASAEFFAPEWMFGLSEGFSIVTGNPPYVGEKGHKETFRPIAASPLGKKFYAGKMDLFYFFFHLGLDVLKENGLLAFITTNYFVTATGAKVFRSDLKARSIVRDMINFNEVHIFESALGQHNMITVLQKGADPERIAKTSITSRKEFATSTVLTAIVSGADAETEYFANPQNGLYEGSENYISLRGIATGDAATPLQKIFRTMQSGSTPLGEMLNINQGIVSGADKVSPKHLREYKLNAQSGDGIFVLSQRHVANFQLTKDDLEVLKPWFKNSAVQRWRTAEQTDEVVIYADIRLKNLEKAKALKAHLLKFKAILDQSTANSPYLHRPRSIDFAAPKIVAPQRSRSNTFGYNEVPWFASADVYFITDKRADTKQLKTVLALLNSKLFFLWLYYKGKRKGEMLELYQKPLSEVPVPKISPENIKPLVTKVDQILAAKRTDPHADTGELEREIDRLVYQLYDLTAAEIALVEGAAR